MFPTDLGSIRNLVSYRVNFNTGQTDQDFRGPAAYANQRIDEAINEAYSDECMRGKIGGSRPWFKRIHSFTWGADATTLAIPEVLRDRDIEIMLDVTDTTPGVPVQVWDGVSEGSGFYRRDMDTWGWLPTPTAARTLEATYIAEGVEMDQDGDIPDLIPLQHRWLLVWSAAILLKTIADESAPREWVKRQEALRYAFHKTLSLGQPHKYPGPRIRSQFA